LLSASPSPDDLLQAWRRAHKPSQKWRKAFDYETALDVLSVAIDSPRGETEKAVRRYVAKRR
jgi:hypothetical protein